MAVTNVKSRDILQAVAHDKDADKYRYFVEKLGVPVSRRYYEAAEGTAAHIAAKFGNLSIVKYAVEKDPSLLTARDGGENTILFLAIQYGHMDIVKYLVENQGANISERVSRPKGNTAIHHAAEHGQLAILKYLIEEQHGDVNITNKFEQPPVFLAVLHKQYPIIVYLTEERKANLTMIDHKSNNILFIAVNADDLSILKYVLDKRKINFDINYQNALGDTLLSRAALQDRYEIVKYLVGTKKADVNLADEWNKTALHSAARRDHFQTVKYLVEHGADPRAMGSDGKLPANEATNERLILFLETAAARMRERRSIRPGLFSQQIPTTRRRTPEITGDGSVRSEGSTFNVQNFLTIAHIIVRRIRGYQLQPESLFATPREFLENRIDAEAIEATRKLNI